MSKTDPEPFLRMHERFALTTQDRETRRKAKDYVERLLELRDLWQDQEAYNALCEEIGAESTDIARLVADMLRKRLHKPLPLSQQMVRDQARKAKRRG